MNIRVLLNRVQIAVALYLSLTVCVNAKSPNVVIIYGDDVGYGDVGAYGSEMIPTPNIDRLAQNGLVFTDGHCAVATCTPSCFSMLTGRYAFHLKSRAEAIDH
jgi:hypothetical protein